MHMGMGITCLDVLDDTLRIPFGERCLGGDGDIGGLLWCKSEHIHVCLCFNKASMPWYLSHDTLWFRVSLLANVENIVALCHEVPYKIMCARNIGTGGIDAMQPTLLRTLLDQG